jgi:hypothetical protein
VKDPNENDIDVLYSQQFSVNKNMLYFRTV